MGVACPEANSIACDRIGIAVWLDSAPQRLVASVGGRSVALRDAHIRCGADSSCPRLYQAMLQPAGLLDGALKVTPDEGRYRWLGRHPGRGDADGHRHLSRRQPSRGDPPRAAGPRLGVTSPSRLGLPNRMQVERPSSALRSVLRDERRPIVVSAVCGVAHQTCEILVPVVIGIVVDRAIEPSTGWRRWSASAAIHSTPARRSSSPCAARRAATRAVPSVDEATARPAAPAHGP